MNLPIGIVSIDGGTAHNAIPRDARAVISLPEDSVESVNARLKKMFSIFENEYKDFEKTISLSLKPADAEDQIITDVLAERILRLMMVFPNGVEELDPSVYQGGPLLAETSNNFAMIRTDKEAVRILSSQRSQIMSARDMMSKKIEMLAHLAGAEYQSGNGYSSWQPDWDSALLAKAKDIYKKRFGELPKVKVIHGGLECGVIGAKHKGMDMISLGPTIVNAHSPDESMYIPSIRKVWDLLTELLISL